MSGSQVPPGDGGQSNADPSMEDILASIRRILSEDAPQPAAAEEPHKAEDAPSDVLLLDQSMMVPEPQPEEASSSEPLAEPAPSPEEPQQALAEPESAAPEPQSEPEPEPEKPQVRAAGDDSLVAPEVMQAAATAVTSLVQRLSAERGTLVRSAGPTIEDLVREELRPMLKEWLDTHLPPLVERLVKAEIERVVGRVIP